MVDDDILKGLNARRAVELTRRLVRAPSINPPGNEGAASEVVMSFLDEIGIKYLEQRISGERRNVITTLKGRSSSSSLLLTGHLDVVPIGDEKLWLRNPFSGDEEGGRIYGRGSTDAKGSLGAMLCALEAVAESGLELSGDLVFAAVVGEETDGLGIKHFIREREQRPKMAVVGEPTQLMVGNAHKGIARFRITVGGKAAHASLPDRGENAISGMAKVVIGLDALASRLMDKRSVSYPTLVVSTISGGIKDNIVPPICSITVDRRLIVGEDPMKAETEVINVVKAALKGLPLTSAIELYLSAYPAMTSPDELIVRSARSAVSEVLGGDAGLYSFEAYCDMGPLVDLAGTKTVILGPGTLIGSHVVNESVQVEDVEKAARIYTRLVAHALCT